MAFCHNLVAQVFHYAFTVGQLAFKCRLYNLMSDFADIALPRFPGLLITRALDT